MALNTWKCNHLMPPHFKGLTDCEFLWSIYSFLIWMMTVALTGLFVCSQCKFYDKSRLYVRRAPSAQHQSIVTHWEDRPRNVSSETLL